jgi:DNA polymerase elongation subunit (family B)
MMDASEEDGEIENVGGNVLNPGMITDGYANKLDALATSLPEEWTRVVLCVSDLDVGAQYPSITQAANISKDTKVMTVLEIEGFPKSDIIDYFGHYITPRENAVYLCSKFYGLSTYSEILKEWRDSRR